MQIERIPIVDREQWLALRRRDVTASAIGALLGVSKYSSPFALYALKAGIVAEEPDAPVIDDWSITISPMGRGNLLEDAGAEMLRRLKPAWTVAKGTEYFRDPEARLGATPDIIVNDGTSIGVVNIKNPEQSIWRREWRQEDGTIEVPTEYAAQVILEAHLVGASRAFIGAFIVGHRTEFRLVEVPLHDGVITRVYDETAKFWRMVENKTPPGPDYNRDGKLLAAIYGDDNGKTVDLSGWNEAGEIADEDARLAAEIKERAERRKAIKAEVLAKVGSAAIATINGDVFATAKTVRRGAYSVQPSEYRDVRIKGGSHVSTSIRKPSTDRTQQSAVAPGDPF